MTPPLSIRPCWHIVAPGETPPAEGISLRVEPGEGFGDGSHETTRLCLQALAIFAPARREPASWRMLDFGSGTGVLSIAAARLGALAEAIEIDETAIAESLRNIEANEVAGAVTVRRSLDGVPGGFDLVIANILRPVLLEFAGELCRRVGPQGTLILSGLVSTDVPGILVRFGELLPERRPEVYQKDDWRALVWKPA